MSSRSRVELPAITFYFDLGSPYAYLTAERIGPDAVWQPILLGGLFRENGRGSWALTDRRADGVAEVERRATAYGLPPVLWPNSWPSDYLFAMRAATYAVTVGSGREFALTAFRAAFQRGRDLSRPQEVLDVAAAVGIGPEAVSAAVADPEIKGRLRAATDAAHARGVFGIPTLVVGDELFWGDDRLDDAVRRANIAG